MAQPHQSNSEPRTELGRLAKGLGLSMHEVPSPPGTAPWERHSFMDPVHTAVCCLVIPQGGRVFPTRGEPKIGVEHPNCERRADLAIDLDSFYCRTCGWNGRVSGAWAVERIEASYA